ncbi:MAG: murein biosynthesis integral membrane protein MurJ [Nitrospira sp.]|nr:murein biosynthesis integral membrane protein MurJ [bacterium]MBL7048821.1 murein biosynthesis integral membrane protein MurJ [Nitrospira sp.]
MDEKQKVTHAATQIAAATSISRVLGFVRDILLANMFGATGMTDAFFIAYRVPNFFRELFAEGSISAAFVPVFTESLSKNGQEDAKKLYASVAAFLLAFLFVISVLGIWLSPYIVQVIAPGFVSDSAKYALTVTLTRVMIPFLFFVSVAALLKGVLNSLRSFFIPATAPIFLNISIITSALFFAPLFTEPFLAIGLAVSVGGALQVLIQVPAMVKKGYMVAPSFKSPHPGLKKIYRLLMPTIAGMGVAQINILISTVIVSYLASGAATYLYYAMRLLHLPIGIFGVAIATAILPSLSGFAAEGDIENLRGTFSFSLRLLFFITLPAMAGLIVFADPIIHVLLQRGEFTAVATSETAYALIFYSYGMWAFVGARVLASTFHSMQDTKTPVKAAAVSIITNIVFSLLLMGPLKHGGLALANSIAAAVNFIILYILLRKKIGRIDGKKIMFSAGKIVFASIMMAGAGKVVLNMFMWQQAASSIVKGSILALVIGFCIGLYVLIMYIFKSEELQYLLKMKRKKQA